jgi:GT2 family glycosyltransferase
MSQDLAFTIILPIYHGGDALRRALASLREIDFPPDRFEVLVAGPANDGESARVTEAESAAAPFELLYVPAPSAERAVELNAACAAARGAVLALTDEHCLVPPEWLRALSTVLEREPDAGIIGGPDRVDYTGTVFGPALNWALNSFVGSGGLRRKEGLSAGKYYPRIYNMAVQRAVALEVSPPGGGNGPRPFDEGLSVHQNVDLTDRVERLGRRTVYAPQFAIRNCRDTTFASFLRRNFDMARTARALGAHRLPHALLAASVLAFVVLAVLAVLSPRFHIVLGACASLYALVLLTCGLAAVGRTGALSTVVTAPLLLTGIHLTRGVGYLFPLPRANRTANGA